MSNYAKLNLLELDDSVGERSAEIEGRFGRTKLGARDIGVSHWRYAPNFRSPMAHKHREQEEAYVVVAGSGRMLLDGEVVELRAVGHGARRARGRACVRVRAGRAGSHRGRRPEARGRRRRDRRGGLARLARRGASPRRCRSRRPTRRCRRRRPRADRRARPRSTMSPVAASISTTRSPSRSVTHRCSPSVVMSLGCPPTRTLPRPRWHRRRSATRARRRRWRPRRRDRRSPPSAGWDRCRSPCRRPPDGRR